MNRAELVALARQYGCARVALCAPERFERWMHTLPNAHRSAQRLNADPRTDAPWARAICVAAWPYGLYRPEGGASVAAYYVEYNAVHARQGEFVDALRASGVQAMPLKIPLKPAAARAGLGVYGFNGLIRVPGLGNCVMLYGAALGEGFELEQPCPDVESEPGAECGKCRRCIEACPTGALSERGVDVKRCLRAHMASGAPVPVELRAQMGGRLLGCEECIRACPHNAGAVSAALEPPEALRRVLDVARALNPDTRAEYMREYGELLGHNYALPNRVLAQAVLVAANLGLKELRPLIEPLADSPSEAVRQHARWALERMADSE